MKQATLCLLLKNKQLSLALKKSNLGKGKYNGYGGKQEGNETLEETALRELYEEANVKGNELEQVAEITYTFPKNPEWDQIVSVYLLKKFEGEPQETEEMQPSWFDLDNLPYEQMWDNDKHWLPLVLSGKKIKGSVIHDEKTTASYEFSEVKTF